MRIVEATPETLLESTDAARLLKLSANQVRMLARFGKLTPRFTTPRGSRLFEVEEVLRLVAERGRKT